MGASIMKPGPGERRPDVNVLPQQLYTAAETRALDAAAIDGHGIPGYTLMRRAGAACMQVLADRWPETRHVAVLCGGGNNGGDGYVIARLAREAGRDVTVTYLSDPARLSGDAAKAYQDWLRVGGEARPFDDSADLEGVVVDALLGTGLDREVGGAYRDAIERINASKRPVLAVDIPSGLSADTGQVLGCAVQAHATVSFIGLKRGLFTGEATDHTGTLGFDALEVPDAVYLDVPSQCDLLDERTLQAGLPARSNNTHKGCHGAVLVVGGERGMPGAVLLAATAALRGGAGLVKVATRSEHVSWLPLARSELMTAAVEDAPALRHESGWADVIALGPGLGAGDWADVLLQESLASNLPMVVDADGLNALVRQPARREQWVLTPHPGEAASLLDTSIAAVQADRFEAARAIAERYGGVCVLKGAGTVIHDGERSAVCRLGNPGMATAGMGDVLTGVVAALLGQGHSLFEAATLGVTAHARAGDLAAESGQRGLVAGDVITALRGAMNP